MGCQYDGPTDQLFLVAGHNDGAVAVVPIMEQRGPQGNMTAAAMACPVMALAGGHTSIVRSLQSMGGGVSGPLCVTGGEDALVCMWTLDPGLASAAAAAATTTSAAPVPGQPQRRASPGPDRQHVHEKLGAKNKRPSPY